MVVATVTSVAVFYSSSQVWRVVKDWKQKVAAPFIVESYATAVTFESLSALAGFYDSARVHNEERLIAKRDELRRATSLIAVLIAVLFAALWRLG